jgi:DNA-binding NtrC family response regulator
MLRLLLVEDDRTLREGLRLTLAADGYAVVVAPTGEEALRRLEAERFDIVITDLHLSPISGLDVLRAAKRAIPPSIVVVMTGDATLERSLEAVRAGASDCLAKPFSVASLRALLDRAGNEARRLRAGGEWTTAGSASSSLDGSPPRLELAVQEFERAYLGRLVRDAAGNLDRAARMARVDRTTLVQLMEKHDIGTGP